MGADRGGFGGHGGVRGPGFDRAVGGGGDEGLVVVAEHEVADPVGVCLYGLAELRGLERVGASVRGSWVIQRYLSGLGGVDIVLLSVVEEDERMVYN